MVLWGQRYEVRSGSKPGLPPWGPHVRFRRVQTLVREGVRWSSCAILLRANIGLSTKWRSRWDTLLNRGR